MWVATEVQAQLEAAAGALADGNWREAHERLEQLPPEPRSKPEVLVLRCRAFSNSGRWSDVERIASSAASIYPGESTFFSQWAWATYRQGRTTQALEIASKAAECFPTSVALAYSVACLNGALDRAPEAARWLNLAIERASNPDKVKLRSLIQPELQCIWHEGVQNS